MRLESLTVKGMLAIEDVTTLDLREMPPGLIALVGRNGNGKTTLLDAGPGVIHRQFPSRGTKELFDYANGRDSYIEALYAIDGRGLFRLRVNLDGEKRKGDAVIEQRLPTSAAILNKDGLFKGYDAHVRELFPSREVLLASAVAAQNKAGSFSQLGKPQRQDLFAQLLGLSLYERLTKVAKDAAALCDRSRATLAAQRDVLARQAAPAIVAALDEEDHEAQILRGAVELRRATLHERICELDAQIGALNERATRHATAVASLQTLTTQIADSERQLRAIAQRKDRLVSDAKRDSDAATDTMRATVADLDKRIANNKTVLEQADRILEAVEAIAANRVVQEATTAAQETSRKAIAALKDPLMAARDALQRARADADSLARVQVDAALLCRVPCHTYEDCRSCEFLTRATQAQAQIPTLQAKADTVPALQARYDAIERDRLAHEAVIDEAIATHREAAQKIAKAEKLAALKPSIDTAHEKIRLHTESRQRAQSEHAERIAAIAGRLKTALQEADHDARLVRQSLTHYESVAEAAKAERDATQDANTARQRAEGHLEAARAEFDETTGQLARLESAANDRARRRQQYAHACAELADVDARLRTVEHYLLDYQRIAKATSRDGLPQLEIDAAGPTVSSICNDLLSALAPQFSVDIVTQVAKADGKGVKDAFEMKVYDNVRGGRPRDLDELSGGEQVLVDEALKNAIAIFVNSRNVSPLQTCWRDETTGPLDSENADLYLQMLRRVHQIGGFVHTLFVTHNRVAAMQADAQVVVESGKVRIVLPPYVEAA